MPRDDGWEGFEPDGWTPPASAAKRLEMPHNQEAEQGLLGALLIDNRALDKVSDFLSPVHFYAPVHGRIYEAIVSEVQAGRSVTPVTLKKVFDAETDLAHIGGASYLVDLTTSVVTVLNVPDYGRIIFDLYQRRELVGIAQELQADAMAVAFDGSAGLIIEGLEQRVYALAEGIGEQESAGPFSSVLTEVIETAERAYRKEPDALGLTTGIPDLDRKLILAPGKLMVLAGASSMGKTALATNIAFHNAKQGKTVGFWSLEMPKVEVGRRIVCQDTGLDSERVQRGDLTSIEFRQFIEATAALGRLPLRIDDTPVLSISQLRTRARRVKRQYGLALVVVDYLQLLRGTGSKQSRDSRVLEISEITRGLKALAKELDVPVIALSQLSREIDRREDKRPQLSDLRESGSIEQDADIVMFVYRQHYYLVRNEPVKTDREDQEKFSGRVNEWHNSKSATEHTAEVIIGKQRGGPTGKVIVAWDAATTSFSNIEKQYSRELPL